MKPTQDNNFGRVFELPKTYPDGFLFGGGKPVVMEMVDWFNPWPRSPMSGEPLETWAQVAQVLRPWLMKKNYVKPDRKYILITDFGESLMFGHEIETMPDQDALLAAPEQPKQEKPAGAGD